MLRRAAAFQGDRCQERHWQRHSPRHADEQGVEGSRQVATSSACADIHTCPLLLPQHRTLLAAHHNSMSPPAVSIHQLVGCSHIGRHARQGCHAGGRCPHLVGPGVQRAVHLIPHLQARQPNVVGAAPGREQHELEAASGGRRKEEVLDESRTAFNGDKGATQPLPSAGSGEPASHLKPQGSVVAKHSPGCPTSVPPGPAALASSAARWMQSRAAAGSGRLHAQAKLSG